MIQTPPSSRGIRFEDGAWSFWRTDKNVRYLLKSLRHEREPATQQDRDYYARMADYIAGRPWRNRGGASQVTHRLLAGGDLMWIRSGWTTALSPGIRARIAASDISIVNLETPIDESRPVPRYTYESFHYNAPKSFLDAWDTGSAESRRVFSLCNNHALDQGAQGLAASRAAIVERSRFSCLGGPEAGQEWAMVEKDGLLIACIGVTYGINHLDQQRRRERLAAPAAVPAGVPAGVPMMRLGSDRVEPDWARIRAWIDRSREAGADLIVLVPHWSYEYEYWPDELHRLHAHQLIAMGIDIVVGTSPHVLQPVELVSVDGWDARCPTQISGGGRPRFGLIAHSLGNLTTIMPSLACRTGAILDVELGRGDSGEVELLGLDATPTVCWRGLGDTWLDARAMTLAELAASGKADPAPFERHARRMLGSLIR